MFRCDGSFVDVFGQLDSALDVAVVALSAQHVSSLPLRRSALDLALLLLRGLGCVDFVPFLGRVHDCWLACGYRCRCSRLLARCVRVVFWVATLRRGVCGDGEVAALELDADVLFAETREIGDNMHTVCILVNIETHRGRWARKPRREERLADEPEAGAGEGSEEGVFEHFVHHSCEG